MKKLEVGEYVRTKDGIIAKITDILNEYSIDCDNAVFDIENGAMMEIPWEYIQEYIVKHSKNIIDLIEVGDFVNNEYMSHSVDIYVRFIRDKNKIKTILTREQYMQNCYKVEEK